ncbi:MAG: nucleotidyltransferase family protein [Gammaproteobacteria bacterium]|nr:nucleotidyltransferase family protein [Gammaproteobacteria bacterium]
MISGVLLAAGTGTRFGAHKLLHRLDDSMLIAEHAARNLITALPNSVAVIRPGDVALSKVFMGLGLTIIECAGAIQGMGASIACGVSATPNAAGWLIALGDMPWIRPQTIYSLSQQLRSGAGIVAPQYQGRRGHPVGFSAYFKTKLLALQHDVGARGLIEAGHERLMSMITDDPGVLADVDVAADIRQEFSTNIRG